MAAFLLLSTQACAHAVLVSSSPGQGERLARAPTALILRFSEPVTHVVLTLTDRYGRSLDLKAVTSGAEVEATPNKPLADSAYALNWRAVSEDGHPVRAAVVFSVGSSSGMLDLNGLVRDRGNSLAALTWAAKLGYCACALFGVGGTFFAFWVGGARPGRANGVLLGAACLCGIASLGLLGVEEAGSSLAGLISPDSWASAIDGSFARSIALAVVSLLLSIAAIVRPSRGRPLSLASILAIGPAFALTGHASDAGVRWLSAAALSVHVAAACFWAGALPRLWLLLGPRRAGQADALRRFSAAIPYSVAAIVVAGLYLAWIEVGSAEALWRTAYGNLLMAKVAVVGCALLLGWYNRLFLTRGAVAGDAASIRSMKWTVSAEIILIVVILSVTALFRFTPPPRALAAQAVYTSVHIHEPAAMATLSFWTRPDLRFDVEVSIADAKFDALDAREVALKMSSVDGSVAPFIVPLRRKAPGLWRADEVQAPCDCDWAVKMQVLVSDFDLVDLDGRIKLLSQPE
jgi:copper transport protein